MYLTIQGIVLRVTDYNDRDALLTVLSRRHGKLTVKARGLRRKNSPLSSKSLHSSERNCCVSPRAHEPDVSITTASVSKRLSSRDSEGSISGMFP